MAAHMFLLYRELYQIRMLVDTYMFSPILVITRRRRRRRQQRRWCPSSVVRRLLCTVLCPSPVAPPGDFAEIERRIALRGNLCLGGVSVHTLHDSMSAI